MKIFSAQMYPLPLMLLAMVTACSNSPRTASAPEPLNPDSVPQNVIQLVENVQRDDSAAFAGLVSYPIERPYPLKDIADSVEMKKYYTTLVDDSLKRVIANSKTSEWSENGWRGWTVRDGQYLWIDDKVYEIPYMSAKEVSKRRELAKREIQTLPADMRAGWMPEGCLIDLSDGTVYRIDSDSTAASRPMRLAVYDRGKGLRKHPAKTLRGERRTEGTAGNITYVFSEIQGNDSTAYLIEAYSEEDGQPRLYHRKKSRPLKRAYWLEIIPADSTSTK